MKEHCKKALAITGFLLRNWQADWRVMFVFALEGFQVFRYIWGVTRFGLVFNLTSTPFMLPFLFTDATMANGLLKVQIYFGLVILLCNAPFWNEETQYLMIRSGRRAWWHGVSLYILTASFLYLFFLSLASTIAILPIATGKPTWGTVIDGILKADIQTLASYQTELVFPNSLINVVYPWAAQLLTFIIAWFSFCLIGLIICLINELSGRLMLGCGAAAFLILLDPVVHWLAWVRSRYWWYYFSPVSWSSLQHWDILGVQQPLKGNRVVAINIVLVTVLILVTGRVTYTKEIVIRESHN